MSVSRGEFLDELEWAILENGAPFAIEDVADLGDDCIIDHGDYAETTIKGTVTLKDGRRFLVDGSCDTTGWDCRSSLDCTEVAA